MEIEDRLGHVLVVFVFVVTLLTTLTTYANNSLDVSFVVAAAPDKNNSPLSLSPLSSFSPTESSDLKSSSSLLLDQLDDVNDPSTSASTFFTKSIVEQLLDVVREERRHELASIRAHFERELQDVKDELLLMKSTTTTSTTKSQEEETEDASTTGTTAANSEERKLRLRRGDILEDDDDDDRYHDQDSHDNGVLVGTDDGDDVKNQQKATDYRRRGHQQRSLQFVSNPATVETRLRSLEQLATALSCVNRFNSNKNQLVFAGCNVHIRNNRGFTHTNNGKGNLVIGYNVSVKTNNRK